MRLHMLHNAPSHYSLTRSSEVGLPAAARAGHARRPVPCSAVTRRSASSNVKAPGLPWQQHSTAASQRASTVTHVLLKEVEVVSAPADTVDTKVTWTVEVFTHVPQSQAQNIGLQLTVLSLDGKTEVFNLAKPTKKPEAYERAKTSLQGRKDTFAVKLPQGFEPAAVLVYDREDEGDLPFQKEGEFSRFFLKRVLLKTEGGQCVSLLANTYITIGQTRRFVRDDALTDPRLAGNQQLQELMTKELLELQGKGASADRAKLPRDTADRIYGYDIYNDLGGDILKNPGNKRTPLGSKDYPYPRRLETKRGLYEGTPYEKAPTTETGALVQPTVIIDTVNKLPRPLRNFLRVILGLVNVVDELDGVQATPWTPQDDNFDTDKTRGFIGNAVSGVLPGVLTGLNRFGSPGAEFESVEELLGLYDENDLARDGLSASGGLGKVREAIASRVQNRVDLRTGGKPSSTADEDGVGDLLKYDVPRSIQKRLPTWGTDEEMGRMYLAGQNPMVIQVLDPTRLEQLLKDSPGIKAATGPALINSVLEGKSLQELAAAAEAPRLFIVDYWAVYDLLDQLETANAGSNRVMHAGRCVLFRRKSGHLVPVIIELAHSKWLPSTTYTCLDPAPVWQVAKSIFQSVDSGWHQLISHWLRTHACVEPYLIATRRQLPAAHPMFRLLMPHFRYTLPINAAARGNLINAGSIIETNFSTGPFSMQLSSKVYGATWSFKEEGLVEDLKKRGFLGPDGTLRVSDYPYAEDGLLIWDALTKYFTKYVDLYYSSDEAVAADGWLKAWWEDVRTKAHPDAPEDGWVPLNSRANLVQATTTIAWVASGHHAAVNFGQYDYSGWMPTHSSLCRRPAPARDSTAWQELLKHDVSSKEFFSYLAPPAAATKVMSTIKLLSAHAEDEHYLSADTQEWLPLESEPAVKAVFDSFVKEIKEDVQAEIDRRNGDPNNISRSSAKDANGLPYTLLYPSSDKSGVTMQGVPYSISI